MDRRAFLKATGVVTGGILLPSWMTSAHADSFRPNFIGYDMEGDSFVATEEYARKRARNFDRLVALEDTYARWIPKMKSENPDVQVGVYINLMHFTKGPHEQGGMPAKDYIYEDVAKTRPATGSGTWTSNFMMNPRSTHWVQYQIDQCILRLQRSRYTHLYIDGGGLGPLSAPGGCIDPRTNEQWTESDWMAAMRPIWTRLRDEVSIPMRRPMWANNLAGPDEFYQSNGSKLMLGGTPHWFDLLLSENYLRGSRESITVYPSAGEWIDWKRIDDTCQGRLGGLTKLWTSSESWQKDRWHRYALATYMAQGRPGDSFYCTYRRAGALPTSYHHYWAFARTLGAAISPVSGTTVKKRSFSHGFVAVNITGATHSVSFSGRRVDQDGVVHRDRITLRPKSGILLRVV